MQKLLSIVSALSFVVSANITVADDLLPAQEPPQRWELEGWETNFSKATVPFDEVINVIARDNIPSIDDPEFKPVSEEASIPGNEPVIGLELNGEARAYPLRIMMWHEIVNDSMGGTPIAVTYCPLCNTSIVFDRRLDGEAVEFGTTGKLRHSDLIMYDRSEQNWWQQFTGEAIVGDRAGEKLKAYPSRLMSLELFRETYPDGQILVPDPRRIAQMGRNPYVGYDSSARPFLFRGEIPDDINPMMRVALVQSPTPVGVTLPLLQEMGEVIHEDLIFRWSAGQASALDRGDISQGRDVGNIEVVRKTEQGEEPVVHEITFAFAARAFMDDLKILQK
ncbi:DUF3179 domain-containing protein [Maritalea mediterranea]|uniref:DUF3179 domain-containing protein n=1 Tax=Maritalea mediterranea TaxID=2909667 RepID=A0ABS9E6L4_9HYPH|nr:DUF3179 domain-containing protein [Maritalea mediterranea]MCF4097869.1 DUF3179 domain-containing protein [Maritalea mediterranea]